MRVLGASVLLAEAFVVFFAALVAKDLSGLSTTTALLGGIVLALALVLTCGTLGRRQGYHLGSALQVVVVATGFVVPAMFLVGGLFAVLWVLALHFGAKGERIAAERKGLSGPPSA